jgi:AcrR family transcriptional regulator
MLKTRESERGTVKLMFSRTNVKSTALIEARQKAILSAAVEIFFEKGYHVSRIIDIAAAAGVSHGTVYNYVSCKEDLLYLVCEEHFQGHEQIVGAALSKARSPRDKLDALLRASIEVIFKYRKHYAVMLRELHHVEPSKRRAFFALAAKQRKIVQNILDEISKQKQIPMESAIVTANILVYLPKLVVSRGWDLKGEVSEQALGDALFAFMQRGLGLRGSSRKA